MPALICGSLAFDTIATFPGRFSDQILPEQLHILNVSFLVPSLRREFGGCAGNIGYSLSQLGGQPLVMAAVGRDADDYRQRIASWGAPTDFVSTISDTHTAQAIIITDTDNNQITAFHPGAMQSAHLTPVPVRDDIRVAFIAPVGR
jgi:adenosine kinase